VSRLHCIRAYYREETATLKLVEVLDDGTCQDSDITAPTGTPVYAFYTTPRGWTAWLLSRPMSWVTFETDADGQLRGAHIVTPKDSGGAPPPSTFYNRATDRGCGARVQYPRARERGAA
jgi:hypothetical protein